MENDCDTFDFDQIYFQGKIKKTPYFLVFNHNAKYKIAKPHLYQKGCRALLQKNRNVSLRLNILGKLVNTLVKPVVLYGADV